MPNTDIFKTDEFGNSQYEIEKDMIVCSLLMEHPFLEHEEIEKLAFAEVNEFYADYLQ